MPVPSAAQSSVWLRKMEGTELEGVLRSGELA
jgi:hypothetical protein